MIDQNKEFENDSLKIITNEKYYRIENIDELQKILNDEMKDKIPASDKELQLTDFEAIKIKNKIFYNEKNRTNTTYEIIMKKL